MNSNSMMKSYHKVAELQSTFRTRIGVKKLGKPTYEVHDSYERTNQKYWISRQFRGKWDPVIHELNQKRLKIAESLAAKNMPGYSPFERALANAAGTIARSHPDLEWRWPNTGFLSWTPLSQPQPVYDTNKTERLKVNNEQSMAIRVKKVALWFGASLVGIALLNRKWVYSHWYDGRSSPPRNPRIVFSDESGFGRYSEPVQLEDGTQVIPKAMKHVIVVAHQEDYPSLKTAPTPINIAGMSNYGYRKVVHIVAPLVEFIRGIGYNAIPSVGDTCLKVPMAMDAGLGEDGRHGLLITPEFGPRVRLGAVMTDLPLAADSPVTFGIHEFCDACQKCARLCPGKAISSKSRTTGEKKNDVNAPTISETAGALR